MLQAGSFPLQLLESPVLPANIRETRQGARVDARAGASSALLWEHHGISVPPERVKPIIYPLMTNCSSRGHLTKGDFRASRPHTTVTDAELTNNLGSYILLFALPTSYGIQ